MTNDKDNNENTDQPDTPEKPEESKVIDAANDTGYSSSGGGMRKLILTVALLLVLGLFAFDQFISKAAYTSAVKELGDMQSLKLDENGKMQVDANGVTMKKGDVDGDGIVTDKDVKQLLNREPSATEDIGENGIVHTYSWARGIPGKSYDTYVMFTKQEDHNVMYRHTDEKPTEEQFRATTVVPEKGSVPAPSGGGMPPANTDDGSDDDSSDDDNADDGDEKTDDAEKADDEKADDEKADDEKADDESADKKTDDEKSEDKDD